MRLIDADALMADIERTIIEDYRRKPEKERGIMIEKCKTCLSGYPSVECVNCGTGPRNYRPYKPSTNADRLRGMSDEEIAKEVTRNPPIPCRMCEYWNREQCNCFAPNDFTCTTGYAEALTLDWLQSPAETEGME